MGAGLGPVAGDGSLLPGRSGPARPPSAPRAGQRGPPAQRRSALQPRAPPRGPRQAGQRPCPREPREDGAIVRAQERFAGPGWRAGQRGLPAWGVGLRLRVCGCHCRAPSAACSSHRASEPPNTTGRDGGSPSYRPRPRPQQPNCIPSRVTDPDLTLVLARQSPGLPPRRRAGGAGPSPVLCPQPRCRAPAAGGGRSSATAASSPTSSTAPSSASCSVSPVTG